MVIIAQITELGFGFRNPRTGEGVDICTDELIDVRRNMWFGHGIHHTEGCDNGRDGTPE